MFIYVITNKVNGKRYVGQTRLSVGGRCRDHLFDAARGKMRHPLANAIRKYGPESFHVQSAELPSGVASQWLLDELERRAIAELGSMVPHGYNVRVGGFGGPIHHRTRAKISAALVGHSHSEETRAAISASKRGVKYGPRSAEHSRKIVESRRLNAGFGHSPETIERLRIASTGRITSAETKEKQRLAHLGKRQPMSVEARARLGPLRLGRSRGPMSQATKDKISAGRQRWAARKAMGIA